MLQSHQTAQHWKLHTTMEQYGCGKYILDLTHSSTISIMRWVVCVLSLWHKSVVWIWEKHESSGRMNRGIVKEQ